MRPAMQPFADVCAWRGRSNIFAILDGAVFKVLDRTRALDCVHGQLSRPSGWRPRIGMG
jgi:hypothetical protein